MRRIVFSALRIGFGIALLGYLAFSGIVTTAALSRLFTAWPVSLAAVALIFLDLCLMSWRLSILFRPQRLALSWRDSLRLNAVSAFFANFLPGRAGGDLAKIFYASKENPGRRTEIIAVLLFDRVLGLFSLLVLPLLLLPFFPDLLRSAPIRIAVAIIALLVLSMTSAFLVCLFAPGRIAGWAAKPGRWTSVRRAVLRVLTTISAYGEHPLPLAKAACISLFDNLLSICTLMLAIWVVNPAGLAARLSVLIPIGQIVNSLPITPGGLGVGEMAFQALFGLTGAAGGADALVCWRIWNLSVGLLGMFFYFRGMRMRIPESRSTAPAPSSHCSRARWPDSLPPASGLGTPTPICHASALQVTLMPSRSPVLRGERHNMARASAILLLAICVAAVGCVTGSTKENVSTTGWRGQKVGQSSNDESGPVPSSTTATRGNEQHPQPKPAQEPPPAKQNLDSD